MISDEYRQKLYDGLVKKKGVPSPESPWWSDAYEEMVYDEEFILDSDEWPDQLYKLQLFWCERATLRPIADESLWNGDFPEGEIYYKDIFPPSVSKALDALNAAIRESNEKGLVNWWEPSKQAAEFDVEEFT